MNKQSSGDVLKYQGEVKRLKLLIS